MASAAEDEALSAADLASRLSESIRDGDSATRLRLKIEAAEGEKKTVLQVQVKARRSAGKTEVMYQVLWPKDRKGQAFLIQREGESPAKGVVYTPPKTLTNLDQNGLKGAVFDSDLAYLDVIENFFDWKKQSLAGKETVDRVECLILESKPGSTDSTSYGMVKSWIDPRRLVALRVEKYDSAGKLACRIETTRVFKDDSRRYLPASMLVRRTGSDTVTEIEGSNIRHDVKYKDQDFTIKALNNYRLPR